MKLEVFQALWAMQQRRPGVPERPVEESFEMIAAAGMPGDAFDGGVCQTVVHGELCGSVCDPAARGCALALSERARHFSVSSGTLKRS